WTSSRPLMASLTPVHKMGQFFGLFSLSGRAAAIIGPIIWGLVVLYCKADSVLVSNLLSFLSSIGLPASPHTAGTIQYRLAILALAVVMIVGWLIFRAVPDRHRA
ncbi:MAG: MFS transporter, partial [candidate division Zixibacteria bacterium]|nr:MFS transporter [candidate division Zixibacteria bacterium]